MDVLRLAAAAATPGLERLIAAGLDLGITEAEAHSAIAVSKGVAIWCRKVQHVALCGTGWRLLAASDAGRKLADLSRVLAPAQEAVV